MSATLRTLPMPNGAGVRDVLPQLRRIFADNDPVAWLPVPADAPREASRLADALAADEPIDDDIGLVVATSGTTGTPKAAMLTAAALRASATATHARLGGPGSWLLALPASHIAGIQVLLRGILAGHDPTVLDVSGGFFPEELPGAVARMPGRRRYTSLVPTQLVKALADPAGSAALSELDAVLVGGAATPPPVVEQARVAGINVVRTYGMSETCGGCVYDGVPLDGVRVRIEDGRVLLGGSVLASGYRGLPEHPAFAEPGWFRTDDAGIFDNGVLRVTGRVDDAILTGGLLVVPQVVEAVLANNPGVAECVVLGLPDDRLGQRVVVVVVAVPGASPTLAELKEHAIAELDATAAPRDLVMVDELPLVGPGKPDRARLRRDLIAGSVR